MGGPDCIWCFALTTEEVAAADVMAFRGCPSNDELVSAVCLGIESVEDGGRGFKEMRMMSMSSLSGTRSSVNVGGSVQLI